MMGKMREGVCPQCESRSVYHARADDDTEQRTMGTKIALKIGLFMTEYAPLDIFVCTNCGYVENYIYRSEDLRFIAANWQKRTHDQ